MSTMITPSQAGWVAVPVIELSDDEPEGSQKKGKGLKPLPSSPPTKRRCLSSSRCKTMATRAGQEGPLSCLSIPQGVRSNLGTAIFPEANADFLWHLEDRGFAVLEGILGSNPSCQAFLDDFWRAMAAVVPGTDPLREQTWDFPRGFRGIVTSYGLPQADFAWTIRAHPRVRHAFARIFDTERLVVSLDAIIAEARTAKTKLPPWLHKDQHPSNASLSVQAVYTHFGSGPHETGTCVVPGSHKLTFDWERHARTDHVRAPEDSHFQVVKPNVPPDSMVFFNSRLVHASLGGTPQQSNAAPAPRPARLGVCVAYAPLSRRSEVTRRKKEKAYFEGKCSSHWPCDRFSLKPPLKHYQILKGAVSLAPPPAISDRLSLL